MPFVYNSHSAAVATNFATSGSGNTEIDHSFLKAGSSRTAYLNAVYAGGKANAATSISGIAYRLKKWTSTSSAGGTSITPTPRDDGMQAATATVGAASAGVTSGTGGPLYIGGFTSGISGPGSWVAPNVDSPCVLGAGTTKSIDLFSASATASLNFEFNFEHME